MNFKRICLKQKNYVCKCYLHSRHERTHLLTFRFSIAFLRPVANPVFLIESFYPCNLQFFVLISKMTPAKIKSNIIKSIVERWEIFLIVARNGMMVHYLMSRDLCTHMMMWLSILKLMKQSSSQSQKRKLTQQSCRKSDFYSALRDHQK